MVPLFEAIIELILHLHAIAWRRRVASRYIDTALDMIESFVCNLIDPPDEGQREKKK